MEDKLLFRKQDYVSYNPNNNKSTCLQCKQQFAGCIVGNIKRHYEALHNMIFHKRRRTTSSLPNVGKTKKSLRPRIAAITRTTPPPPPPPAAAAPPKPPPPPPPLQPILTISTFQETLDIRQELPAIKSLQESLDIRQELPGIMELKLSKNEFLKYCVGLVTVKNLSPLLFDDEKYFKKIIAPYEEEFGINLNSTSIMDSVESWSIKIFNRLISKFSLKRINLKLDLIKGQQRNLITINVSSMENFRVEYFTLGIIQLESCHNDLMLKDEILNCLNEFNIDWRQLNAITGDSYGQFAECLKELRQEIEKSTNEDTKADDTNSSTKPPCVLNCGYQWILLAMQGFFNLVANSLEDCRKMVHYIITKYELETYNTATPLLDNPLQWESTLSMICSLKEFLTCHNDSDIKMEWSFVEQFIEALTPVYECCQQLQKEQYIVGDFYRDWLLCEVKLKQMEHNEHASKICQIMGELKVTMLANTAFNAALYCDPRFNFIDSPFFNVEQRNEAVNHIILMAKKFFYLNSPQNLNQIVRANNNDEILQQPPVSDDPYGILELEFQAIVNKTITKPDDDLSFRQKLENISLKQRQAYAVNVLDYWRNQRFTDNNIRTALNATLAVAIGQYTSEKVNKALSKSKITDNNLRDILLVNLNESVLEAIHVT